MDHMIFELVHKPTFDNQLLALPPTAMAQVIEKVGLLRVSPAPDAKNKKRLVGYKGAVYRLRSGDYRIIYTFDAREGWVALLGVDARKDIYRNGNLVADDVVISLANIPDERDILTPEPPSWTDQQRWTNPKEEESQSPPAPLATPQVPEPLPRALEADLLLRLRIPPSHHAALLQCQTLDDLIAAPIPETLRGRVFDALVTPDYDRVQQQPTQIITSPDDFRRFYEGSLVHFLLQLDPEQQRFVDWAVNGSGPALIKGGPGTGKTIIALYRVRALIAALRRGGITQPRVLFTAYTNTLVESSRQLLKEIIGPDASLVTVCTADSLVSDLLYRAGAKPKRLLGEIGLARAPVVRARQRLAEGTSEERAATEAIAALRLDFLLEEIDQVIVAREHRDLDAYLAENRTGRGVRLTANQRRAIWRLHEARETLTAQTGEMTFSQQRRRAVEIVRGGRGPRPYDGVLIDEAQDLEPTVLRLLMALCKTKDRLFLTADPNQSIYGSGFRWADVHEDLRFRGRTGVLRKNYRTTRQIATAAEAYLAGAELEVAEEPIECPREGLPPLLRYAETRDEEKDRIVQFVRSATRELRVGIGGCALLVPTRNAGIDMAQRLTGCGLAARFMEKKQIDLEAPVIKVITMHSAKGLEFPIVAVAGLAAYGLHESTSVADEDELAELRQIKRRVLYVAMTRAMDCLLVVTPEDHPLLGQKAFDPARWDLGEAAHETL